MRIGYAGYGWQDNHFIQYDVHITAETYELPDTILVSNRWDFGVDEYTAVDTAAGTVEGEDLWNRKITMNPKVATRSTAMMKV